LEDFHYNEERRRMRNEGLGMMNKFVKSDNRLLTNPVVLSLLLGMLMCGGLSAQETQALRLSPDEAVERAVKNNLSLESVRITSATKKRASDYSWNQFIPGVTVSGSLIMDNEKSTISGMAPVEIPGFSPIHGVVPYSVDAPQWHVAGSIQASLTISVAMFENMRRLRLDYEGGMVSYEKAKLQLERDVRKAYNSMLLLQENINLLKRSYEAAEQRVEMARANYRAGLAPELTLLQAQVAVENMRPVMDQAENGFRLSMAQFAMFMGMDYNTPFELTPVDSETDFISLDVQELISRAASGKPDIQELKQSILMLQSAHKAQFYSLLPFLNLSWYTTPAFW
jgi:outer membrane protein TolC